MNAFENTISFRRVVRYMMGDDSVTKLWDDWHLLQWFMHITEVSGGREVNWQALGACNPQNTIALTVN
jgi:hypothetical protein